MISALKAAAVISLKNEAWLPPGIKEISLVLTEDEEIKKINRQFRNLDKATDVLSFPLLSKKAGISSEPCKTILLGDIIISVPAMRKQALAYGHSEQRELAFLFTHGLLHLLGYDHEPGLKEEREMTEKTESVLGKIGLGKKI